MRVPMNGSIQLLAVLDQSIWRTRPIAFFDRLHCITIHAQTHTHKRAMLEFGWVCGWVYEKCRHRRSLILITRRIWLDFSFRRAALAKVSDWTEESSSHFCIWKNAIPFTARTWTIVTILHIMIYCCRFGECKWVVHLCCYIANWLFYFQLTGQLSTSLSS